MPHNKLDLQRHNRACMQRLSAAVLKGEDCERFARDPLKTSELAVVLSCVWHVIDSDTLVMTTPQAKSLARAALKLLSQHELKKGKRR
jgi:hypothetical protein